MKDPAILRVKNIALIVLVLIILANVMYMRNYVHKDQYEELQDKYEELQDKYAEMQSSYSELDESFTEFVDEKYRPLSNWHDSVKEAIRSIESDDSTVMNYFESDDSISVSEAYNAFRRIDVVLWSVIDDSD